MRDKPDSRFDVFGLVRPAVDAHTLGVSVIEELLKECGFSVAVGDMSVCRAVDNPALETHRTFLERWLASQRVTRLGFSCRLDPARAAMVFGKLLYQLSERGLLSDRGGPIKTLYFAGLPAACRSIEREFGEKVITFQGDETPGETLERMGIDHTQVAALRGQELAYDDLRMRFARELINDSNSWESIQPSEYTYPSFGTQRDLLLSRIEYARGRGLLPLMRAHVGPYVSDREEAVRQFLAWCHQLGEARLLDILSIGSSQLTQEKFGEEWGGAPNGGGVPINSVQEFEAVWAAARPMLVRTYAGTVRIPELAEMYERALHMAWHTFSFWWFSKIDGRGPNSVLENLHEHIETLRVVARHNKPFEPNIPHHFAFRGADDVSYVVSGVLAARTAKAMGVKTLVLQVMLNTPKATWGVQDLAKARVLLGLCRELEDKHFKVLVQPRAGLDYFSPDLDKAKIQLAAVSALMDDIEPGIANSPDIIHVVSYSEAVHLADPPIINDSVRITKAALARYRQLRSEGLVPDMSENADVLARAETLLHEARTVLKSIERNIPRPYTAMGLYLAFKAGYLPVPYLWECKEEFAHAINWRTKVIKGAVKHVDSSGAPLSLDERCGRAEENLAQLK